jgi:putative NADH-flavin reductase
LEETKMYVILGASGKTGGFAADALIDMGKPVRVVVRSAEKGAVWKARGADVAVADVDEASALARVLRGADGAYIIVPRNFAVSDVLESRERCIESLVRAVDESEITNWCSCRRSARITRPAQASSGAFITQSGALPI